MTRLVLVAIAAWVPVCLCAQSAPSELELDLVHVVNDDVVGSTRLVASDDISGTGDRSGSTVSVTLKRDGRGHFEAYTRTVMSASEPRTPAASLTVTLDGNAIVVTETGSMGSRTRSILGPPIDVVADPVFPEIFIPPMMDPTRRSLRVLMLSDMEVRTVVIEDRESGRYAAVPEGGITVMRDGAGRFAKLVVPGPEGRVIVPAGTREAGDPRVVESRLVLVREDDARLGFTLTRPNGGSAPFPLVVLLADAGDRDRHGAGGGSLVPTLKLLAAELAGAGIATARADKRGVGESRGRIKGLATLVADAAALCAHLAADPSIDRDRIFIAGHGEGALVAAEAARQTRCAGVIMLAGPARPLPEALEARLRVRLSAAGKGPEAIESEVRALRREMETLRTLPEGARVSPEQALLRDIVRIDPATEISGLKVPVLAIHGAEDRETPASQVMLMRASLAFSSGRARFEMVEGADHTLLEVAPGASLRPEPVLQADVARRLAPAVPRLIRDFVGK